MTISEELTKLAYRTPLQRDRARAALHLLDWLGTVLAARNSETADRISAASIPERIALSENGTPEEAAFHLGALGNLYEMDDLHRASILHAGDTVCAAALAVALRQNSTGQQLLDALLAGYETAIRIGIASAQGGYTAWYNSGTCGVFGAAMAAIRLLSQNAETAVHALGHAGMQAAGIWQCRLEPGLGKQLATAHAARAGVSAARLADAGAHAPRAIFEGPLGFFAAYYPDASAERALAKASDWLLHEVSVKPWPACRHTHPAIAAALELRARGLDPQSVETVTLCCYEAALSFCDISAPASAHDARFSLQHMVAIALRYGAPTLDDSEDMARRADATTAALRAKVGLVEDEGMTTAFPDRYQARLDIKERSGRLWSTEAKTAPGDPEAPLSDADICAKFRANAHYGHVDPQAIAALESTCLSLTSAQTLTPFKSALSLLSKPLEPFRSTA